MYLPVYTRWMVSDRLLTCAAVSRQPSSSGGNDLAVNATTAVGMRAVANVGVGLGVGRHHLRSAARLQCVGSGTGFFPLKRSVVGGVKSNLERVGEGNPQELGRVAEEEVGGRAHPATQHEAGAVHLLQL